MTGVLFSSLWFWCLLLWKLENMNIKIGDITVNGRLAYLICTGIPILFIMGARSAEVGTDTWNYAMNIFPTITTYGSFNNILSGDNSFGRLYWLFFYYLGNVFSSSPEVYIRGESFIIILGTCVFIYRTTKHVALATMVFLCCFFVSSLSLAREYVGIVIGVNAVVSIFKNYKSIIGWGLMILTIQIHAVNAILIVAIIFGILARNINSSQKIFVMSIAFMGGIGLSIGTILPILIGNFLPEYIGYLNTSWSQNILEGEAGFGLGVLIYNMIYLMALYLCCRKLKLDPNKSDYSQLYYAILPGAIVGSVAGIIFHDILVMPRVFYSLIFLGIPLLSATPYYYNNYKKLCIGLFILAGLSVAFFRVFMSHEYIYTFFWEL